jgi:thiamine kinase-like enzyme
VYIALKFLWDHGFGKSYLTIPRPLFYSEYFQGIFYRGAEGHNLYEFIRTENYNEIKKTIPLAANWFAKLHNTSIKEAKNFNKDNSRLKTVIPGANHIFETIKREYSEHYSFIKKAYEIFIKNEEDFLASTDQRWLIHGDAHPENIIKISQKKLAVIDFTDLCLSDVARDLGTFIEQLDFMIMRKINDKKYSEKMKNYFLKNYFKNAKIELDDDLQKRIDNYLNWTKVRTATFFLLKDNAEPERALPLIKQVKNNLKI